MFLDLLDQRGFLMTGVGLLSGSQGSCGGGGHSLSVQVEKIHLNCVCICLGVCVYDSLCFQTPYCGFTLFPPSVFVCHLSLISLPYLFCDKPRSLEQGQAGTHCSFRGLAHSTFPTWHWHVVLQEYCVLQEVCDIPATLLCGHSRQV